MVVVTLTPLQVFAYTSPSSRLDHLFRRQLDHGGSVELVQVKLSEESSKFHPG